MIVIFVVALVVFGPDKLPELARNIGKVMAEFKRATGDFKTTLEDHLRDLERESEQRRIAEAAVAAAAKATAASTEAAPQTSTADTATAVAGVVPAKAPWTQAIQPTDDAVAEFGSSPTSSSSSGQPENNSGGEQQNPSVTPDSDETRQQESAATHEPPVHDDRPA